MTARVLPFPARREEARHAASRVSRDIAIAVTAHLPSVPRFCPVCGRKDMTYHDRRTGRVSIYDAVLRYIDGAVAHGTPADVLQRIPDTIAWYIADVAGRAPTPTAPAARGVRVTETGTILKRAA